jgi:hypothetical protein
MNIYLVERTDDYAFAYDNYDSFVCYAKNEESALNMIPKSSDEFYGWTHKENCKAILLGICNNIKEEYIILSSFNAG